MTSPDHFVTSVDADISEDGQVAELQFVRKNGKTAYVQFPTSAAAEMMLNIEQALAAILEKQQTKLNGHNSKTAFGAEPKHVVAIQGAVAQKAPVLSFVLKSGLRLDFRLEKEALSDLILWLRELAGLMQKPSERDNQSSQSERRQIRRVSKSAKAKSPAPKASDTPSTWGAMFGFRKILGRG
jgi:DNA polymerase I-like protein with 3'-5' exonuclease and polymerase domains